MSLSINWILEGFLEYLCSDAISKFSAITLLILATWILLDHVEKGYQISMQLPRFLLNYWGRSSWMWVHEGLSINYRPQTKFWGKVIFLHLFVILFTWGACMVAPGGACVVAPGGACVVAWGLWRGMHGCSGGACMVAPGGVCVVALEGACMGYDEIRRYDQWAGRYASYWNAFLFGLKLATNGEFCLCKGYSM